MSLPPLLQRFLQQPDIIFKNQRKRYFILANKIQRSKTRTVFFAVNRITVGAEHAGEGNRGYSIVTPDTNQYS
jgi:hypothetical protein